MTKEAYKISQKSHFLRSSLDNKKHARMCAFLDKESLSQLSFPDCEHIENEVFEDILASVVPFLEY